MTLVGSDHVFAALSSLTALSSVFNSSGGFGKFGLSFISLTTPRPVVMSCGSVNLLNPATARTRGLMIDLLA